MHPQSVMGVAGLATSEVTGHFQMRIWFGERIVNGTRLTRCNDRNKDKGRAIHTSHRYIVVHRRHNHKFVRDGSFAAMSTCNSSRTVLLSLCSLICRKGIEHDTGAGRMAPLDRIWHFVGVDCLLYGDENATNAATHDH